jgi:hypothetical protein
VNKLKNMALEFYLRLQTSLDPKEIVNHILKDNEFIESTKSDDGDVYGTGFITWVYLIDEDSKTITFENVGIKTNINVKCWHQNSEYEIGLRNILKIFISVLKQTNGDAVVQLEFDDIRLLRKDGKIYLNPKSFSEDEEAMWRFKDVPFEYEVKDMNVN